MWFLDSVQHAIASGVGIDPFLREERRSGRVIGYRCSLDAFTKTGKRADFDVVTMVAVIEHLPPAEARRTLEHVKALLRPGGVFVFSTPTPASKPVLEFLAFRLGVISRAEIEDHKVYYDRRMIEQLSDEVGMVLTHYKRFQFGFNSLGTLVVKG